MREVEALETDLGIPFEHEVLAQFNGPSASIATPDGEFAAVSDLADPEEMRALLPRLAPRLPPILRGLQGLGNRGLVALLLFAPDAPLVPGALPALVGDIAVRPLGGASGDEQLYEITGLQDDDENRDFAVPSVVFGMIGDRFVVATDAERARAAAQMEVSDVDDARGAARRARGLRDLVARDALRGDRRRDGAARRGDRRARGVAGGRRGTAAREGAGRVGRRRARRTSTALGGEAGVRRGAPNSLATSRRISP